MLETLEKFWGEEVEISEDAALTWMRQPHYYMGLYSYTYSAGLTIATQVCARIEREGGKMNKKHFQRGRSSASLLLSRFFLVS